MQSVVDMESYMEVVEYHTVEVLEALSDRNCSSSRRRLLLCNHCKDPCDKGPDRCDCHISMIDHIPVCKCARPPCSRRKPES